MSKNITATSARGVSAILKSGIKKDYSAGGGLYLKVSGENTGSWFIRYQMDGKRQRMGLGKAGAGGLSLADARANAQEFLALVAKGINPIEQREAEKAERKAKIITFDQVAAEYIAIKSPEWKSAKNIQKWRNTLATYASPVIGHLPPSEITTAHIVEILKPIWETKTAVATKLKGRLERVLDRAKYLKLRTGDNPAAWRGNLEYELSQIDRKKVRNMPALPYEQVSDLWKMLKHSHQQAAPALMFLILTAARSGEVRGARWCEIDFEKQLWVIPAERMKMSEAHQVPLSTVAIELLQSLPRIEGGLIFEGRTTGRTQSDATLSMFLRRADAAKFEADGIGWRDAHGQTIVPHGFRSTFRDWAAETTHFQNHVVEMALAHSVGSAVERAYRRGDLLEHRRELMEAWAGYITKAEQGNVIQFSKRA